MILFFQSTINSNNENDLFIRYRGQSNMKGNAQATSLSDLREEYKGTFENVKVWNGLDFVSLDTINDNFNQFPVSQQEGGFGSEITSSIKLSQLTGKTVYFFKYAIGSTGLIGGGINGSWHPNSEDLFQASKIEELNAIQWLNDNNIDFDDLGEVWYQGESDRNQGGLPQSYIDALNLYISERRLYNGNIPFYIIELHPNYSGANTGWFDIISAQNSVANNDFLNFNISNDGQYEIDGGTNTIHLNSVGQQDLGEDLANFIFNNMINL